MKNTEQQIYDILNEIGIPCQLLGRGYIEYGIEKVLQERSLLDKITGRLYPEIAKKFDTTPSRAERAIRHAIEVAWDRGDMNTLQRFFGYTVSGTRGKPTNGEFFGLISKYLLVYGDK